jgi:hypothetical protein
MVFLTHRRKQNSDEETYMKELAPMSTKIEFRANQISFKKIDDLMGPHISMEVAYATRFQRTADYEAIAGIFHDTAIVTLQGVTFTLNTGGFVSQATREKMNLFLQGHGYVAQEGGKWYLYLADYANPKGPADYGRGPHFKHLFFDGISFDVNSHQINEHARPSCSELDFAELFKAYRLLGGTKRAPNIAQGVSVELFDKWLDETVKLYVANVEYGNVGVCDGELGCAKCMRAWRRLEHMQDEGLFQGQFYGYVTAETKLGLVRACFDGDIAHLYEHLYSEDYDGNLVLLAFYVFDQIDDDRYNRCMKMYIDRVQKAVSRFLRRMLHKGVVGVA